MSRLEQTRPTGPTRARGLVSSRVSGARVDVQTFAPPDDLAPWVETLWVGRWNLPADAPHTTRLLGDPCIHVVLSWGDGQAPHRRIVGVWTRLWENTLTGHGTVRAAKLRAGAAGTLLANASAVRDRIDPLTDHFETVPSRDGLCGSPEDDHRVVHRLQGWLRGQIEPSDSARAAVQACALLRTDPSILRVAQLAEAMGRSSRVLQRLFRRHVGASPKFLIRRHRLQEAAARLEHGTEPTLADLAYALGYADQAHFARDWKAAVSVSATRFARDVHR